MRRYESIVIIDPDLSAENREPFVEKVKDVITQQGGYLAFVDEWGEKKLAYEIKKKERGYYVRFDLCGNGALVDEMERFFRIDDRVMKYMTVLLEKQADIETIKQEITEAESKTEVPDLSDETPKTETPESEADESQATPLETKEDTK
jgi:small subunit ribosomal protein S6